MTCQELTIVSFRKAYGYVKQLNGIGMTAVNIPYGRQNNLHFRAWAFAGDILLKSSETAHIQQDYRLTIEKWHEFTNYVKQNPTMQVNDLAEHYQEFGCTNFTFWPSIIKVSTAILNSINNS